MHKCMLLFTEYGEIDLCNRMRRVVVASREHKMRRGEVASREHKMRRDVVASREHKRRDAPLV